MPVIENKRLLEAFQRHRDLCASLLQCSRRQMALIADEDYTELLAVIGRKQRLIEEWDELKKRQPPLALAWNNQRAYMKAADRIACENLIRGIQSLYKTLLNEERESTEALTLRRDNAQRQIQSISKGAQTHQAYRDHLAPTTHRHLNIDQ